MWKTQHTRDERKKKNKNENNTHFSKRLKSQTPFIRSILNNTPHNSVSHQNYPFALLSLTLTHTHFLSLQPTMNAAGEPHSDNPNSATDGPPTTAGARYKLMSPAKLPISRSPCVTVPPGLSPTSFLESPVLLSNMKVSISLNN